VFGFKAAVAAAVLSLAAAQVHAGPSLLLDVSTGEVIAQDRAGMPWFPASLTKLMTAYLTFQALRERRLKLDDQVLVSSIAALQAPSKIGVRPGGRVSVDFALQALLVYSANDMAVVLAEAVGGSLPNFIVLMNRAAKRLEMNGTRFLNPNGLHDANQFSTARDLAILARSVLNEFPEYRKYFDQEFMSVGKRKLRNRNALLFQWAEVDGMKTGFVCAAGFNLVASASLNGRRLMAVVLGASNSITRADWAQELLKRGASGSSSGVKVSDIINDVHSDRAPPDLTAIVCEGRRGLALKPATALKGFGVALGTFEKREDALKALRIWSDAGDAYMHGASKGLVQLPNSKEHTAMVWDLEAAEAQLLCDFLREQKVACEFMQASTLSMLAEQARATSKAKTQKRTRRKKKG
jgi:D-alanyl-D-alanine carboxypeptidase